MGDVHKLLPFFIDLSRQYNTVAKEKGGHADCRTWRWPGIPRRKQLSLSQDGRHGHVEHCEFAVFIPTALLAVNTETAGAELHFHRRCFKLLRALCRPASRIVNPLTVLADVPSRAATSINVISDSCRVGIL
jgi:hypothetical protein